MMQPGKKLHHQCDAFRMKASLLNRAPTVPGLKQGYTRRTDCMSGGPGGCHGMPALRPLGCRHLGMIARVECTINSWTLLLAHR